MITISPYPTFFFYIISKSQSVLEWCGTKRRVIGFFNQLYFNMILERWNKKAFFIPTKVGMYDQVEQSIEPTCSWSRCDGCSNYFPARIDASIKEGCWHRKVWHHLEHGKDTEEVMSCFPLGPFGPSIVCP